MGDRRAALVEQRGNSWSFRYVPSGQEPEGDLELTTLLIDEAGNEARVSLGVVRFDFTAAPPFASAEVRYTINPYEGLFRLNTDGGAFLPNERVRVYLPDDDGGFVRVAETVADTSGRVTNLAVPTAPGHRLYVGRVDEAGNETTPQEIEDPRVDRHPEKQGKQMHESSLRVARRCARDRGPL